MWISSCSGTTCWKDCSFSTELPLHLWVYFWFFCSIDLFFYLDTNTTLSYRNVSIMGFSRLQEGLPSLVQHWSFIARASRSPGGPVASGGARAGWAHCKLVWISSASSAGVAPVPHPARAEPVNPLGSCCLRAAKGGSAGSGVKTQPLQFTVSPAHECECGK